MPVPHGEGGSHQTDVDALLQTPDPKFHLIEPTMAPSEMLDQVQVNTEGRCLEAATPVGTIAVEIYWNPHEGSPQEDRGDFFPALSAELDPAAAENPLPTQQYPYTMLPDGALYEVVVRAPIEAADAGWSEPQKKTIGSEGIITLSEGSMHLAAFRHRFPGVEVDLPEGRYTITATEQTKPTLAIAARVENGEPLARKQEVSGEYVHYREMLAGNFLHSGLRPDTAVSIINSRTTMRAGKDEADNQRLEFTTHDGFQRTGEGAAAHSGLVELIVMQAKAVRYSDFTFTPYSPPVIRASTHKGYGFGVLRDSAPISSGNTSQLLGGLAGGETRYRPPEAVKVNVSGVRELRAIAAFRFALTAETPDANA